MTVKPYSYPIFDPGGLKAIKQTSRVRVMMSDAMHDTAVITLRGEIQNVPELQPGTPVRMQYGWANVDLDTFYGYVDHTETHYHWSTPDASHYEDVVCLGVSYALKDPFVGAWSNAPASAVAQKIASQYYLSSVIEPDDYVWPQLASPGDSAWSYLKHLANKIGYGLSVNQSMLRFMSVDTAVSQFWPSMPMFRTRDAAPNFAFQSISSFQVVQGDAMPLPNRHKAVRQINGMDLTTGRIIGAVNDGSHQLLGSTRVYPFFGQQISDTVVNSQGMAQAALQGMSQSNRFAYQATATLSGLTTVKQDTPILISGIDANQDGMWWVQEVTHKIESTGYSMDVCLGRDSLGDGGQRPTQGSAVAYAPNNPFNYTAANVPPTILVNNKWRARNSFNAYVNAAH